MHNLAFLSENGNKEFHFVIQCATEIPPNLSAHAQSNHTWSFHPYKPQDRESKRQLLGLIRAIKLSSSCPSSFEALAIAPQKIPNAQ